MPGRLEDILARRLREIAAAKKIPLSHVADRAGVARSYFWLLLDGENSATLAVLQRIADALDVPPLALLTASPDVAADDVTGPKARRPPRGSPATSRAAGNPRRRGR